MSMLLTAVTEVRAAERAGQDLGLGTFATQFIARGTILMAHNPPFLVGFNWYRHSKGRQVRAVDQDDQRKTIGAYDMNWQKKGKPYMHVTSALLRSSATKFTTPSRARSTGSAEEVLPKESVAEELLPEVAHFSSHSAAGARLNS